MQIPLLKIRDMNQNRKVLLKQRNRRCIGWVSGNRDDHHSCVTCNGGFSNAGKGFFVNQRHQRMLDSGRQLFHAVEAKQSTGSAFYQPAPAFAALERHVLAVTKELVQEGLRRSFVFTAVDDDIRRVLCNGADSDRVQVHPVREFALSDADVAINHCMKIMRRVHHGCLCPQDFVAKRASRADQGVQKHGNIGGILL